MPSHAMWSSTQPGIAGPSSSYQGGGNSRIPATAGTISARMIRIQRMTAVCGGMVLISAVALRGDDFGGTSSRFRERHHTCLASRISMASTSGFLRQRLAFRSAVAGLSSHSAWLNAATPAGQNLLAGCAAKWITTQCE